MKRALLAEYLGSALLAAVVIGSGIAAQHFSPHEIGLELLENAAVTAAGLYTIILMFGPVSGGHFNPVVSLADATFGGIRWRTALAYIPAQTAGCISGALLANAMFVLPAVSISTHHRASPAHLLAEIVATAGLLLVIFALARTRRASATPAAVGGEHLRRYRAGLRTGLRAGAARGRIRRRRPRPYALPRRHARRRSAGHPSPQRRTRTGCAVDARGAKLTWPTSFSSACTMPVARR